MGILEKPIQHTQQPLNEMATVCKKNDGYGIVIKVYSGDHEPPHAHLFDTSREELGRFEITDDPPEDIEEIIFIDETENLLSKHKWAIVEWANSKRKGTNIYNWEYLNVIWEDLQET
jgi:hypothetical protein